MMPPAALSDKTPDPLVKIDVPLRLPVSESVVPVPIVVAPVKVFVPARTLVAVPASVRVEAPLMPPAALSFKMPVPAVVIEPPPVRVPVSERVVPVAISVAPV